MLDQDLKQRSEHGGQDCMKDSISKPQLMNLDFGTALVHLCHGQKVRRAIWKGHWFLASNANCMEATYPDGIVRGFGFKEIIVAKLATGEYAPAQPYQADLLAQDWEIVDYKPYAVVRG